MEKSDIIFKASFNEFSSARDNVESSAYLLADKKFRVINTDTFNLWIKFQCGTK
jgi:hypothetical protein